MTRHMADETDKRLKPNSGEARQRDRELQVDQTGTAALCRRARSQLGHDSVLLKEP